VGRLLRRAPQLLMLVRVRRPVHVLPGPELVELLGGLGRRPQRSGHVLRGLHCAGEGAGVQLVGAQLLGTQPLLQQACLFPPAVGEACVAAHATVTGVTLGTDSPCRTR
jgi:hypothetical protein